MLTLPTWIAPCWNRQSTNLEKVWLWWSIIKLEKVKKSLILRKKKRVTVRRVYQKVLKIQVKNNQVLKKVNPIISLILMNQNLELKL